MSAYICNPEQFGILGAFAAINGSAVNAWNHNDLICRAQEVAKGLAKENIRSVATRYPDDVSGSRPGPCLLDEEIEEAAAIYAGYFVANQSYLSALSPEQVLVLCSSLDYQSSETDDWETTTAFKQLQWIRDAAIRKLPGYEAASWAFDLPIPEIEALYERNAA